jgi:hypothetical protein
MKKLNNEQTSVVSGGRSTGGTTYIIGDKTYGDNKGNDTNTALTIATSGAAILAAPFVFIGSFFK